MMRQRGIWLLLLVSGCGNEGSETSSSAAGKGEKPGTEQNQPEPSPSSLDALDEVHTGNFWLGPVDYDESEWHNACAPSVKYPAAIRDAYGDYIMGLANEVTLEGLNAGAGQLCDTCVALAANGKSLIARVVTFGQETGPDDIDVSPQIDAELDGESGRTAQWHFVSCPTTEPIQYTFDGREWDNTWFFRVWVRNARLPVAKLEFRLGDGAWTAADWQGDGAWQAASQDFSGGFSLRVTALDGQSLSDAIPGLNTFDPDVGIASKSNFE